MSDTHPPIDEHLNKLADIVCQSLQGERAASGAETEALLKSLLMSGYASHRSTSLQAEVEARVKDQCREPAMHRGGALSAITKQMQEQFSELTRWESKQPKKRDGPKAANISSATDA